MNAPQQTETRHTPARPDWRRAARLLARGEKVVAVAAKVGCSRSHLSRKRNHDPAFQAWIAEFQDAELVAGDPMTRLRQAVHGAIENEVRSGNVRVVLWLADRLNLVTPPTETTSGPELQDILNGLTPDELREFELLGESS